MVTAILREISVGTSY